jgi:hypothetical protein
MSDLKHTPEPWIYQSQTVVADDEHGDRIFIMMPSDYIGQHNMKRIVSCVNALAGIKDPENFMEALRCFLVLTGKGEHGPAGMALIDVVNQITVPEQCKKK